MYIPSFSDRAFAERSIYLRLMLAAFVSKQSLGCDSSLEFIDCCPHGIAFGVEFLLSKARHWSVAIGGMSVASALTLVEKVTTGKSS